VQSEALPPWEVESRLPRHPKTIAGIQHRARIAETLKPLLVSGTILPTNRQIAAMLGLSCPQNAGLHYAAVLDGLGVETELRRVTVRVVA
jgi:hypothetical protein